MQNNFAARVYQRTGVETADTLSLVLMCYDATVRDLEQAKSDHSRREMDSAYKRIRHAQDLVTELLVGLDHERGGIIATNLGRLYNYFIRQMIGINSSTDPKVFDQLIGLMSELRDAWEQIRKQDLRSGIGREQGLQAPEAASGGLNLCT